MIRRGRHRTDFTIIPNIVFRSGLSMEAAGCLCYLISKPENWKVRVDELAKHWHCCKDKASRVMREIRKSGFAELRTIRGENGKVLGTETVVYDHPMHRDPEKPDAGKTESGENRRPGNQDALQELNLERTDSVERTESMSKPDPRVPPCPHLKIINLYQKTLPELQGFAESRWSGSESERNLRTRWREDEQHRSLKFWEQFFNVVRTNDWWMGRDKWKGADLHWLITRKHFVQVVELGKRLNQQVEAHEHANAH